jgi:hypothetical protein
MSNAVYIPKKINVGYQKRDDTYNKKLAYVIYYDNKGKLRKETSWNSWRDEKIPNEEFENTPTEGFVLNKKVGGYCYDWNPRQTYSRVHDPRGFEFEITIPNLLYILENTNSIKGKGLEGKFVYGWSGSDLLLIPEAAPEYAKYVEFSEVITKSVKAKDLVLGGTYKTNKDEEVVYLGRFDYWDSNYRWRDYSEREHRYTYTNKGLHHFFYRPKESRNSFFMLLTIKSLSGRIVQEVSNVPVPDYAKLMDKLEHQSCYSPYDKTKDKFVTAKPSNMNTTLFFNLDSFKCHGRATGVGSNYLMDDVYFEGQDRGGYNSYYYNTPVRTKLKEMGLLYDYATRASQEGVPAQELIDKLGLTVKEEYICNGKKIK